MNILTWLGSGIILFAFVSLSEGLAQPTFINPIPIPPLFDAAADTIHLEMRVTTHRFNPGNPSDSLNGGVDQPNGITSFCYNVRGDSTMSLLGPTLRWHTHERTVVTVTNMLGQPTTTHWHGAEVPPQMDGGPHQGIMDGSTWTVSFNTLDSTSTMWYHPHYHNMTVQHVQKGLSGMIIVEDEADTIRESLPHTYGVDDYPIIIGDLGFTKGSSSTSGMYIDTTKGLRPINLVNGVTNPYLEVPAHMVRLRILNGSTRKGLLFGVSDSYDDPYSNLQPFYLIASDGGYMITPDTLTELVNGPGARDEIILDLTSYSPGDMVYLSNLKDSMPNFIIGSPLKAPNGGGQDSTGGNAFLQLRIVADDAFPDYTPVNTFRPFTTEWTAGLSDTLNIAQHRLKELISEGPGKGFTIDGEPYDMMMLNDTVCVDTKEIWAIQNKSGVAHPFHIHKIQFRVLDAVDSLGNEIDLAAYGMNGPKDDVLVFPGWTLRFLGQFDDYPSPIEAMNGYMYHCHILTHEDSIGGGMMHQFVVTDQGVCQPSAVPNLPADGSPDLLLVDYHADGTLSLSGEAMEQTRLTLFDRRGGRVRSVAVSPFEGRTSIPVGSIPSGLYLVEWETGSGVRIGKVVVRR